MDNRENPGKTFWSNAALDGGIAGLILFGCILLDEFTKHNIGEVISIIKVVALVGCIYIFVRRRSMKYVESGFTFSQSMGYIVAMMVFTGFITGIGDFLSFNFISEDYYKALLDTALETNPIFKLYDEATLERSTRIIEVLFKNPLYFIFSGIVGKAVSGGLIGLFVSALVKRPPVLTGNNG